MPAATGGRDARRRARLAPGSVGAIACMCRPHCWQYAKPTGVGVPQRGHVIVPLRGCAATRSAAGRRRLPRGRPGAVGGRPGCRQRRRRRMPRSAGPAWLPAPAAASGGPVGGAIIGGADRRCHASARRRGADPRRLMPDRLGRPASALPQLRQNFIPGGFSPRHARQIVGNPGPAPGVCSMRRRARARVPQFRQNDDPAGSRGHNRTTHRTPNVEPVPSVSNNARSREWRRAGLQRTWRLAKTGRLRGSQHSHIGLCSLPCWSARLQPPRASTRRSAPRRSACVPTPPMPGSLRGPFTGRVARLDDEGAGRRRARLRRVDARARHGAAEPAGAREFVGSTDAGGDYKIPALGQLPARRARHRVHAARLQARLRRVSQRSPVPRSRAADGLRAERQPGAARALAQRALARASPALRRWRHRGRRAHAVGARRCERRARRQARRGDDLRPGRGEGQYVVAAQLLTEADIKARTKYDGQFETGPLSDEPDTATYSSQHFKALGRPETWDVAIRMWRLEPGKAQERYEELLTQLPGVAEKDDIASRSFVANENDDPRRRLPRRSARHRRADHVRRQPVHVARRREPRSRRRCYDQAQAARARHRGVAK